MVIFCSRISAGNRLNPFLVTSQLIQDGLNTRWLTAIIHVKSLNDTRYCIYTSCMSFLYYYGGKKVAGYQLRSHQATAVDTGATTAVEVEVGVFDDSSVAEGGYHSR